MMDDCIFCKISRGVVSSQRIYENDSFFSIYDHEPEVEGHALVISKKHFETVLDLPNTLGGELMDALKKTTLELVKKYGAGGFNVINNGKKIGGQLVPHVHFHIIPRRDGDKFRCWNLGIKEKETQELMRK